jgi:hypothetical protein
MNKTSNLGIVVGLICSILLSLVAIIAVNAPQPIPNTNTQPSYSGTSPEISSPYLQVNGVTQWFTSQAAGNKTSSTICAVQSPAATSTVVAASIALNTGATDGAYIRAYKAATVSATTTFLFGSVSAGAKNYMSATTTLSDSNMVFAPSQFIVFDMNSGYAPTGTCQAIFQQL